MYVKMLRLAKKALVNKLNKDMNIRYTDTIGKPFIMNINRLTLFPQNYHRYEEEEFKSGSVIYLCNFK